MPGLLAPSDDFVTGGLLAAPITSRDAGGPAAFLGDLIDWWRAQPSVAERMTAIDAMRSRTGDPLADFRADANNPELRAAKTDMALNFNMAGIFAGPKARTANLPRLAAAETLEQAGVHPETIRQETGWFRGADKAWRFEIDDSGAWLTPEGAERTGWNARPTVLGAPLSRYFDHPELIAAYPDLASAETHISNAAQPSGLHLPGFRSKGERFVIEAQNPADARSVLLHELQHGIQGREGFAPGGNPEASGPAYRRLAGEVEARNVQNRRDYSADLRRQVSPAATQDVPYGGQILLPPDPYSRSAGEVIDMMGALERRVMDDLRKRNLADLTRSGYFPTQQLPNGYSIARGLGFGAEHEGVGFALVTPQGAPALFGRSAEDLIRRGFPDEEARNLLLAIGGPRPPQPPRVVRGPWGP